jgi:hypothetical protein
LYDYYSILVPTFRLARSYVAALVVVTRKGSQSTYLPTYYNPTCFSYMLGFLVLTTSVILNLKKNMGSNQFELKPNQNLGSGLGFRQKLELN